MRPRVKRFQRAALAFPLGAGAPIVGMTGGRLPTAWQPLKGLLVTDLLGGGHVRSRAEIRSYLVHFLQ
jgi:hypothetical protein